MGNCVPVPFPALSFCVWVWEEMFPLWLNISITRVLGHLMLFRL